MIRALFVRFSKDASGDPNSSERVSEQTRSVSRRRKLRNRRVKAILAGGLVFGIGATATLAAWTDTEQATGEFKAGTFATDLAVDGQWSSSTQMTFNATGMYPGSKVYAPVFVRTTPSTTMDGTVSVSSVGATGSTSGIAGSLEYRAVTTSLAAGGASGFTCNATTFTSSATYVFGGASATTPLKTAGTGTGKQSLKSTSGSVQAYCFEVTLPASTPNAAQGTTASNVWKFNSESVDPTGSRAG